MTRARKVIDAIDDALILRDRNPVMFARLSRGGYNCFEASAAFSLWQANLPLPSRIAYFDRLTSAQVRERRLAGRRQRAARQIQRRAA